AELVPDHRLGDVHGHVLAAVVDRDRVSHHVRSDGGTTRPRLDDPPVPGGVHRLDLDAQVVVDERALLHAARHLLPPPGPAGARHSIATSRISFDGSRGVAKLPAVATSCPPAPAPRASLPPAPGLSSMLCTVVPTGM